MSAAAMARLPHWNWLRRGLEVHALDRSPVFCEAVRTKRARPAVLSNRRPLFADMRNCRLPRSVDLVLAEFASLNNLAEPPRPAPCAGGCGSRAGRRRVVLFRRQHTRGMPHIEYPQTFWLEDSRFRELVQHGSLEADGRRARVDFEWLVPAGPSLAARARDAVARLLDRRGNQASPAKGRFRFRAAVR